MDCITCEKSGSVISFVPTPGLFSCLIFPFSSVEAQGRAGSPQHCTDKKLGCKGKPNISSDYVDRFFSILPVVQ